MADAKLSITESVKEGKSVIELAGDIDAHTAPLLKEAIEKSVAAGKIKIVFDFSKLNYISSAGIGVLNAALNVLKGKSGKMVIANAGAAVRDTLEVMYFTKKVDLYPSTADALKSM